MQHHVSHAALADVAADWLIVGVPQAGEFDAPVQALDDALGGQLTRLREAGDLTGKRAETLVLPDVPAIAASRVLLVGLGPSGDVDGEAVYRAYSAAALVASKLKDMSVACLIPSLPDASCDENAAVRILTAALCVGCVGPGLYQKEPKRHPFRSATFVVPHAKRQPDVEAAVEEGVIIGEAMNLVRELVNRPASDVYPETFARRAAQLATEHGIRCDILEEARLRQERMGSLLAVSAGSARPPRVVILEYRGAGEGHPVTALVGKGVTFDSGGLSLKPTESMNTMKGDMAGAATVLGVMTAIARLQLPVNIMGAMGLVENMISGSAYKLGDVLVARNGVTIEVLNTDAEGRLVLADVLSYVADQKVDRMIDLATLTGACVIALGEGITGAFTNNQPWCDEVLAAARRAGEPVWPLPMHEDFNELLKSDVADVKNVGKRWGGASIAAKFLERFVGEIPWVHLDIAGPAFAETGTPCRDSGGTGVMVRTLVDLFRNLKTGD